MRCQLPHIDISHPHVVFVVLVVLGVHVCVCVVILRLCIRLRKRRAVARRITIPRYNNIARVHRYDTATTAGIGIGGTALKRNTIPEYTRPRRLRVVCRAWITKLKARDRTKTSAYDLRYAIVFKGTCTFALRIYAFRIILSDMRLE